MEFLYGIEINKGMLDCIPTWKLTFQDDRVSFVTGPLADKLPRDIGILYHKAALIVLVLRRTQDRIQTKIQFSPHTTLLGQQYDLSNTSDPLAVQGRVIINNIKAILRDFQNTFDL